MSSSETDYLKHMLDEIRYLQTQSVGLDAATFQSDPTLRRAFVRSLEIIGEAARHVSEPFRTRYPAIPWQAMAGMHDRVIHDYLGVDYEIVWDVVRNKVPALRIELERILATEDGSASKP